MYLATHRMLARPAAIKLIRPETLGADPDAAELATRRFRREAEAAASLRSPHTVELYDFGVSEDRKFVRDPKAFILDLKARNAALLAGAPAAPVAMPVAAGLKDRVEQLQRQSAAARAAR